MGRWMLIRLLSSMRGCVEVLFVSVLFSYFSPCVFSFAPCFSLISDPFSIPPIFATAATTRHYNMNVRYLILRLARVELCRA
jgi:hypothetical protein